MTGPADGPPEGDTTPRVPAAAELTAIDADAWGRMLVHVRAALHDLTDDELTPELQRLRASPTSRLAAGRVRAALARVIAEGGPLWRALHERLTAADLPERLGWLVTGSSPPGGTAGEPEPASPGPSDDDLREQLHDARRRAREMREERDLALRRADGAEARAGTMEDKLAAVEQELDQATRRIRTLREALEEEREERRDAVARERRRQDRRVEELESELTEHRRREQERTRRRQAEERRHEREDRDPASGTRRPGPSRPLAEPGRPSRLPDGVRRDTTEGARALLTPGRRVLIDGYNVARTRGPELGLEEQRGWMVRLAHRAATRFDVHPIVVFDGSTGVGDYPGVHRGTDVSFSADGVTADDEIVFAVAAAEPDEPLLVVTDDRDLRDRVADRGADVVGTGPFVSAVS